MTVDVILVCMTVILTILYIVFQILFFRFLPKSGVIKWLVYLYGFLLTLASVGTLIFGSIGAFPFSWDLFLGGFILVGLLFALSCVWYVCPVFGIIESSMRMHMLREIARHGEKGMSKQALNTFYNVEVIVQKRLDRFIGSGELVRDGTSYVQSNRLAFFLSQVFFSLLFFGSMEEGKRSEASLA